MSAAVERVRADIEALQGEQFAGALEGVTRHAYTAEYLNSLGYFQKAFEELGFQTWYDPVGTFVASNREPGAACFGIGSHCDSVRGGGAFDGVLGVICALEVCRLAKERDLDIPLRAISFLEEEGAGFGQLLLGSRIVAGAISDEELDAIVSDDGVRFVDAARQAGFEPDRIGESPRILDGLIGWIEVHIEQGKILESEGINLGIVDAIAGLVQGDIEVGGSQDHAGATPMNLRSDAGVTAAEVIVELERLARSASADTVATVGEIAFEPNVINIIPGRAKFSLDIRSASGDHEGVADAIRAYAESRSGDKGQECAYEERQRVATTHLDDAVVAALERSAEASGVESRRMHSAAVHDTMMVARRVPSAMVFVPCKDGVSHSPDEHAEAADGALAAAVVLGAIEELIAV